MPDVVTFPSSTIGEQAERFMDAMRAFAKREKLDGPVMVNGEPQLDCCPGFVSVGFLGLLPQFGSTGNCPRFEVQWEVRVSRCLDVLDDGSVDADVLLASLMTALADTETAVCAVADFATVQSGQVIGPESNCVTAAVTATTFYSVC